MKERDVKKLKHKQTDRRDKKQLTLRLDIFPVCPSGFNVIKLFFFVAGAQTIKFEGLSVTIFFWAHVLKHFMTIIYEFS